MEKSNYKRLAFILIVSFVCMYGIMFLNVDEPDHIYLSLTRFYMTLLMISVMAVLMIVMMPGMYTRKKTNVLVIGASILIFVLAFFGVHKQVGIGDIQYMKGMIPHHSIAIMTSKNAHIKDTRVRKLANGIIKTQVKEIGEMKILIDSIEHQKP